MSFGANTTINTGAVLITDRFHSTLWMWFIMWNDEEWDVLYDAVGSEASSAYLLHCTSLNS